MRGVEYANVDVTMGLAGKLADAHVLHSVIVSVSNTRCSIWEAHLPKTMSSVISFLSWSLFTIAARNFGLFWSNLGCVTLR